MSIIHTPHGKAKLSMVVRNSPRSVQERPKAVNVTGRINSDMELGCHKAFASQMTMGGICHG